MSLEYNHIPVMLEKIHHILSPYKPGLYIDCTFGGGGYSKKILQSKNTQVLALDRDISVRPLAQKIKSQYEDRFEFSHSKFSNLSEVLDKSSFKNKNPVAVIFDLGLSSFQIDNPERGFSYKLNGKLSMEMGINNLNAEKIINNFSEEYLKNLFQIFGEDKDAKLIAKLIVQKREQELIKTTEDLSKIIMRAKIYKNKKFQKDICAKVFQSIRMVVNQEFSEIFKGLSSAIEKLSIDGKIIVVTFHSIEDRLVKKIFDLLSNTDKNNSRYIPKNSNDTQQILKLDKKKFFIADDSEVKNNSRSRSAKLRFATKHHNFSNNLFNEITVFKKYFDLENLAYAN